VGAGEAARNVETGQTKGAAVGFMVGDLVGLAVEMDHSLGEVTVRCCAECGEEGGASLKTCKSCKLVKYCNADCQKNHWPKQKKNANDVLPSYMMRRCSRTLRLRRTVPSASYQCL